MGFSAPGVTAVAGRWAGGDHANIGDFKDGVWHLDLDGDSGVDAGETFDFGQAGDQPVVGDWNGDGKTKLGLFRPAPDGFSGQFILDSNNNRGADDGDESFLFGAKDDRVVVGDWTGDGKTKVGVFRDAASVGAPGAAIFTLDLNNNHAFDGDDQIFIFGAITDGLVIGDWDGNGIAKVGVYRDGGAALGAPGVALFSLDTNGNRGFDQGVDKVFLDGLITDQFVGGNWHVTGSATLRSAAGAGTGAAALTQAELASAVPEAIASWATAGLDLQSLAPLQHLSYVVANLDAAILAQSSNDEIKVAATAAGHGWSAGPVVETGRMDLFTVLAHEMGHTFGLMPWAAKKRSRRRALRVAGTLC